MTTPAPRLSRLLSACAVAALLACGSGPSPDSTSSGSPGLTAGASSAGTGTGGGALGPTAAGSASGTTPGTTPDASSTSAASSTAPVSAPASTTPTAPAAAYAGPAACDPALGLRSATGDLNARLGAAAIVASGSEGFRPPTGTEQLAFEHGFGKLLAGEVAAGASELAPLGFEVTLFHHTGGDGWLLVEESQPRHGGGTFAINLAPARNLWLEAPHADSDTGTLAQTVAAGLALGARAMVITGANRCADSAATACSGSTVMCGGTLRISDAAHSADNDFTAAHRALRAAFPGALAVSVHGMETDGAEAAVVGDGSTAHRTASISITVRDALNRQLTGAPRAYSCNAAADDGQHRSLCGTSNVQGRIDNGAADACFSFVSTSQDHFVHVEQSAALRGVGSGVKAPDALLHALAETVPCSLPGHGLSCPQVAAVCP